jgi:hypothetical protein
LPVQSEKAFEFHYDGRFRNPRAIAAPARSVGSGNMPAQRRGRQFHRRSGKIRCCARPTGLPCGKNAGDEQAKAAGDQRLPGLAGGLPGRKGRGPHAQDRSSQSYYEHDYDGFLAVLKKNGKKLDNRSGQTEPAEALWAEFEGSMGKLGPLRERIRQTDELIDATGVQAPTG